MVLEHRVLSGEELEQLTPASVALAKFTTSVDAFGNHLTGILLIKRIDSSSYRIGFVSQIGMSIFVFDISKDRFNLISCMEELNDNRMIDLVRNDIILLLFRSDPIGSVDICSDPEMPHRVFALGTYESRTYCYLDTTRNRLTRLESASRGERLVRIDYSDYENNFPTEINIKHYDIPMEIHLTLLNEES
jgi:hypothetical protein